MKYPQKLKLSFFNFHLGFVLAIEKRSKEKMEQLKVGMNALIKENETLKQELEKKQKSIIE